MDLNKLDKIQLNFIIGLGRSGTTLLVTLLNQNQNCISSPEIHHFIRFYKKYKNISEISQQVLDDYRTYIDLFFRYKKNPLIGPPDYSLINSLNIGDKITYSQLTKLIYLGLYGDKGLKNDITVIVDKNPYYTLQLKKIKEIFPDAKHVALVRDYRGFLLSNLQSTRINTFKKSTYYYALAWNLFMKEILNYKKISPDSIKVIRYEDLVSHKETVIKEIFEFLNVSFSPAVFDFHKSMDEKIKLLEVTDKNYQRMVNKISNLSKPINESRVQEWKTILSCNQLKACDIICSKYGPDFGYSKIIDFNTLDIILTRFKSIPSFIKVKLFEWLKSPELHLYYRYKV